MKQRSLNLQQDLLIHQEIQQDLLIHQEIQQDLLIHQEIQQDLLIHQEIQQDLLIHQEIQQDLLIHQEIQQDTNTPGNTTRPTNTPGNTTRPTNTPGNVMLYAISNKIKSDINNLKDRPPCRDDSSKNLITDISQLKGRANELINNTNDPPSPSSIDYFNNTMNGANQVIQKVSQLPQCNCPQGTYSADGSCICPAEYPNSLIGDDGKTVYCSNVLCKDINHGKFVPDMGSDPSKNQCLCDTGYAHDDNKYPADPKCYNLTFSNALNTWSDNIKNDISDLNLYLRN